MKRTYPVSACGILLCALFSLSENRSDAQALYHFPQPGMVQTEVYHKDWTMNFQPVNASFIYQNDTVVGPYTYSKFSSLPVGSSNPFYMYYDNGKVYMDYNTPSPTNPTGGVLLYDFAMNVGDSIQLSAFSYFGYYTVDSVSALLLPNGQTRKYMELKKGTSRLKWIDCVGDIEHGFFYGSDFEGGYGEFVCQHDSSGSVYSKPNSSFVCNENQPYTSSGTFTCNNFSYNVLITPSVSCFCSGSVQVSGLTGGTPNYALQWSTGQTGMNLSNVCAGNYTVDIADGAGNTCAMSFYVPVTSMSVTSSYTVTDSCNGVATACVNVNGGTSPYVYVWSPAGGPGACTQNLVGGSYTVCVTDANGCTSCRTITIPLTPLYVNQAHTQPTCPTCCNGNITVTPQNGHAPYTITTIPAQWPSAGNFCNGTYQYCVTDAWGCTWCDSVTLAGPTSVTDVTGAAPWALYPNPANAELRITDADARGETAELFDMRGQLIGRYAVTDAETRIAIGGVSPGLYVVRYRGSVRRFEVVR